MSYEQTERFIAEHPFARADESETEDASDAEVSSPSARR